MKYNQDVLDKLDGYGLRSSDSLDILDICHRYVDKEKNKIKIASVKGFAKLVKEMRMIQQVGGNASKQEKVIDETLKKIESYGVSNK